MERIHTLIDKLYQQKNSSASPAHLLFTVQLLQQELSQLQNREGFTSFKKVSVTLPMNINFSEEGLRTPFSETGKDKEIFVLDVLESEVEEEELVMIAPVVDVKEYALRKPTLAEPVYQKPEAVAAPVIKPVYVPAYNSAFETVTEVPTLTQYAERREIHHAIADVKESLNDRLKDQKTEVAHILKAAPIKDLRKAVGINDRFVFVKELFRGDDAMYERSIKTINGFHIYSEAEYWITRELKYKLGWNDDNETVAQFNQLVKRRFA